MLSIARIFFGTNDTRPFLVLICLLLAGLAEAVGLMTFLPILTQLAGNGKGDPSPLNAFVINAISSTGLTPTIGVMLTLIVTVIVIKSVLSFAALSYVGYAMANVAAGLRKQLLADLMRAKWLYFTDQPMGRIANIVSNDATRAASAYLFAGQFIAIVLQVAVYVIVAFIISWKLAALGTLVGGLIALALNVLVIMTKRAGMKQTDRTSDIVTLLSDTLSNIKVLKATNRQGFFSHHFGNRIQRLKKSVRKQAISKQGLRYGEEIFVVTAVAVGVYAAAIIWKIPLAELLVTGLIFVQVVLLIGKAQKRMQNAAEVESAYWAVHNMIADVQAHVEADEGTKKPAMKNECRFEQVSFSHAGKSVLEQADLTIPAGKITVIHGPSGSGKTTIADLLIGLYRPDQGRIMIDGTPLNEVNKAWWRSRIGYVPQEPTLLHDTIRSNITLGDQKLGDVEVNRALEQAGLMKMISQLPDGLDTIVGERGSKLSGGQKQRIALARALVTRPKLLILDEVTSALDEPTEAEICDNIRNLPEDYTIFAITHRPAWTRIADRLYEIRDGKAASC